MKIDLAEKHDGPMAVEAPHSSEPYYPTIYIRGKEELTDAKMDQEVVITGRIKGIHEEKRDGKTVIGVDIECRDAEVSGKMHKKSEGKDKSISRLSSMADNESEIDKGINEAASKKKKADETTEEE